MTLKQLAAKFAITAAALAGLAFPMAPQAYADSKSSDARNGAKPNILFVMMDDVGIDQLSTLGYGGGSAPPTPTINAIAAEGLRFRNTWSMPECSNGRMALLTGRYPFRTNVFGAIGGNVLANSQISPYDLTAARLVKEAGYKSALFGKYHLGGPENNQYENGGPGRLGWDYFHGWIGGLPGSIDTTAGGAGAEGTYSCGYVPSTARASNGKGANSGACYVPGPRGRVSCRLITGDKLGDSPGLTCLNAGGVLVPDAACQPTPPGNLSFDTENAYYVSPLVINRGKKVQEADLTDPRGRGYRSSLEVNAAIAWIRAQQRSSSPWMATVSFSAAHTPIQPPPRPPPFGGDPPETGGSDGSGPIGNGLQESRRSARSVERDDRGDGFGTWPASRFHRPCPQDRLWRSRLQSPRIEYHDRHRGRQRLFRLLCKGPF